MQLVLVRDQLHDPYTKGGDKGDLLFIEIKYLKIAQSLGAETNVKIPLNRTAPVLYCSLLHDWVLFLAYSYDFLSTLPDFSVSVFWEQTAQICTIYIKPARAFYFVTKYLFIFMLYW